MKPIRILFCPKDSPEVPSGYGAVGKGLLPYFAERYGKENVLILAPVYQQGMIGEWHGMTMLPGAGPVNGWGEELLGEYQTRYKPTFVLTLGDWGHLVRLPQLASRGEVQWVAWVPYDYVDIPKGMVDTTVHYAWKTVPWTGYAMEKFKGHGLGNLSPEPIPLGFDPEVWKPLDPDPLVMQHVGFEEKAFNILFIQANQRRKYLEEQLSGIVLFRRAHPDVKIRIYMHTPSKGENELSLLLMAMGLQDVTRIQEDYTFLTGGESEADLNKIMNCADVVMDCCLEGMGLSQLYAQALNLPAITLVEGPGSEIVTYGAAVPSLQMDLARIPSKPLPSPLHVGQALEEVYKLKGSRSKKARDLAVARYSWPVIAKQWFDLIENVMMPEMEKFSMVVPELPSAMLLERAKRLIEVKA